MDILLNPGQNEPLIFEAGIAGCSPVAGTGKAEKAQPIVKRNQNDIFVEQIFGSKVINVAGSNVQATRMYEHYDGVRCDGGQPRVDIEIKTILIEYGCVWGRARICVRICGDARGRCNIP